MHVLETLRKYPPVLFLNRQCTAKSYKVPNSNLTLEKGTNIFIPVYGLQKDPEYYPNPEIFDPERFNEENKAKRHPCVYLPFGEGPRICIGKQTISMELHLNFIKLIVSGLRFGMMQTKVGLAVLLSRYNISLNGKTKLPLKYDAKSFILTTEGGIWLNVQKYQII